MSTATLFVVFFHWLEEFKMIPHACFTLLWLDLHSTVTWWSCLPIFVLDQLGAKHCLIRLRDDTPWTLKNASDKAPANRLPCGSDVGVLWHVRRINIFFICPWWKIPLMDSYCGGCLLCLNYTFTNTSPFNISLLYVIDLCWLKMINCWRHCWIEKYGSSFTVFTFYHFWRMKVGPSKNTYQRFCFLLYCCKIVSKNTFDQTYDLCKTRSPWLKPRWTVQYFI